MINQALLVGMLRMFAYASTPSPISAAEGTLINDVLKRR